MAFLTAVHHKRATDFTVAAGTSCGERHPYLSLSQATDQPASFCRHRVDYNRRVHEATTRVLWVLGALKVLQSLVERILQPLDCLDVLYMHGVWSEKGAPDQRQDGDVQVQQARDPRLLLVHHVVLGVDDLVLAGQRAEHDAQHQDLHPGALQQTHLVCQREGGETCRPMMTTSSRSAKSHSVVRALMSPSGMSLYSLPIGIGCTSPSLTAMPVPASA
ncbi:hypothetical protein EYF80_007162 [Liparis tanakae]|uniref:Uncharacterized protein n=1 Tax=Liparis tanakae TaxID=230148 RepID=A0A4Z2IYM7_9TELE|nr:hypothetical protein EYF80_007162 [Liparis tanakae]